jgi:GNAT superfamily N-acetyltransferase
MKFIRKEQLSKKEQQTLWNGIEDFTQPIVGDTGRHDLSFLLHDDSGEMIGGVQGNYDNFGWLWIDSLWVSKNVRGKGLGIQLLNKIETEAIEKGCTNAHLTSFSYQAANFYINQGYDIFGELKNYPQEHSRCWLKKSLIHPINNSTDNRKFGES